MVTPFDRKGNIDFQKTTQLIEYLIENGTDSIVVCWYNRRITDINNGRKIALFNHVVKVVNRRVPVIAGTGN